MKKTTLGVITAVMMALSLPSQAATNPRTESTAPTTIPVEAQRMIDRLYEIKAMDVSTLQASEKKQLRMEVKNIKHDLKAIGGGVYISAAAIIIILLILLLL